MEKKFSNSQRTDKSEKILKNNTPNENQEPLVSDIKESLEETIKSTLDMYRNFIVSIESTLGDQDLKNDSIDLISNGKLSMSIKHKSTVLCISNNQS